MPEYLAPGVYVEEVDTGSKPIEGVSTSTAGMVGVTERGPVNVPMLVTSYGEFRRLYGDALNPELYTNSSGDRLCYLPHAVEGFFTNGGKRVYVTRVLAADKASAATTFVFDSGAPVPATTSLLRPITSASLGAAYLIDLAGLSVTMPPTWLQIGSGGEIEFSKLVALPGGENDVKLDLPLAFDHASGETVERQAVSNFDSPTTLSADADAGATMLSVAAIGQISAGDFIEVHNTVLLSDAEILQVKGVAGTAGSLEAGLRISHSSGHQVRRFTLAAWSSTTTLAADMPAVPGDAVVNLTSNAAYATFGDLVKIGASATAEVRRIAELSRIPIRVPLPRAAARGTMLEVVAPTPSGPIRSLTKDATVGGTTLWLDNRNGLDEGDTLKIRLNGADNDMEFAQAKSLPNRGPAPDPGVVILEIALMRDHPSGTQVQAQTLARANPGIAGLAVSADKGSNSIDVSSAMIGVAAGDLIRLLPAGAVPTIHRAAGGPVALTPRRVTLAPALVKPHAASSIVQATMPLFEVRALDPGQWGNRLKVAVREPSRRAVDSRIRTPAGVGAPDATHIRLESANGVELGTVLQKWDPATNSFVGAAFKVIGIDRVNSYLLTLNSAQTLTAGDILRSHEFDLDVFLLRQPDKANPSRDDTVINSEAYRALTLDPRHGRYLHKIIGTTWDLQAGATTDEEGTPLRRDDHRSEGESDLIRVRDVAMDLSPAAREVMRESVRVGPRFDLEVLPDGRIRPTRYALRLGDDRLDDITDITYIGSDDPNLEKRTGLYSLANIEEISIVAAPGRTNPAIQNALINHCELMRYRFAVLDAHRPPQDSLNDIQNQRQQFDTKYAALYHPWLVIRDPFPTNLAEVADYPVPPSGHVMGIYARTDIERGVHKTPANEVVRGVIGLQRLLNKGEQDILNPYPVNINVIRDFRPNNRGIRVWGGRVITNDPDWKYVNVRRLLIFIEASIERGLQWVVFEPNAEPLWARVNRTVSNFLTSVWRDGALEGTKPEEAFFVKVDRTTMTQTDFDNGRLIVLIGVAPVKPAEFVIVRIGLWTAHAET